VLTGTGGFVSTDTVTFIVDAWQLWLPLGLRNR